MAKIRGGFAEFRRTPVFQHGMAVALAVVLASSWAACATAQTPPSSQIPEKIEPPLTPPPGNGNKPKLNREDGLVKPPSNVDPDMEIKPRNGGRTPVIPPPGSPGGDETIRPK